MGSCCLPRTNIIYRVDTLINQPINNYSNSLTDIKNDECLQDMPEVAGEIYVNYGIKRMKGYKCELNIDDLNSLREKCWSLKINLNKRYRFIRQAVLYDSVKCEDYLLKNGFTTLDGCINLCTDQTNFIYSIPNFCVNDPYYEKHIGDVDNFRTKKCFNIYLKNGEKDKEKYEICDDYSGKYIKDLYKQKNKLQNCCNIRLFFGGIEVHDNDLLYQHEIKKNYTIQVLSNQIDDK